MNRKIFFLVFYLLLILTFRLHSQNTWEHVYDPFPYSDGYGGEDVVKCQDGGYVFCGNGFVEDFMNPGIYEECFGFTLKVNANGIMEWAYQETLIPDPIINFIGLTVLSDGGIVTALGPKVDGSNSLVKRDVLGETLWEIDPGLGCHSLINTNDGGFIAVGNAVFGENIKKYSSNGILEWENCIIACDFYSVTKSYDDGFIAAGMEHGPNYGDVAVVKINAIGDTLWTRYLDGFGETDKGRCVIENSNHEIIVVGDFDYAPGFILKLDQTGETLDLEIVNMSIARAFYSANEYNDNSIITWGTGPGYYSLYNRFDNELNHIDSMIEWGSRGDKGFLVDDGYLVFCKWPFITVTKTLYQPVGVDDNVVPSNNIFLSNYPNPFNPNTIISFSIPEKSEVELNIFNIKGQLIKTLIDETQIAGEHSIIWDGRNESNQLVSSGIYFYKLETKNISEIKKCLLLK